MNITELETRLNDQERITREQGRLVSAQQDLTHQQEQQIAILETRIKERATIEDNYIFSKIITGTTSASAGTETTHTHTLNREPSFVFITSQSNGVVYLTSKSKDDIKVKGSASSLNFTTYLLV